MIFLEVKPSGRAGRFLAYVELIKTSRQPFLDGARGLVGPRIRPGD